jgi:hypothetical protein
MGEALHVQPRPQDPNSWQLGPRGLKGVMAHALPHLNKNTNIYIYILTYDFIAVSRGETKKKEKRRRGSVPWTGAGVPRFLQALQDKGDRQ